jgi:hypothetical protein
MNTNKTILATLFAAAFTAPLAVAPVQAQVQRYDQQDQQAPVGHYYSQAELDQMLAPIALYPDGLLSQVLMAATYPAEVAEAARWTRDYPGLQGDEAVRAVQNQDWDPSVKSLVAFPQILQRMQEQPGWMQTLGDAFLDQEPAVMDTVQQLRRRAQAQGNLRSDEQIHVVQQGPAIVVEPASPEYLYVPYYDPLVVYGTWWWPAYRPVAWAPWPGYARPYRPGVSVGFWWGRPVGLSANFFFGGVDWRYRQVRVMHPTAYYYRPPVFVNRTVVVNRNAWQHDPSHRRGIDYRTPEARQRFAGARMEPREFRASSGTTVPATERPRPQFQRQFQERQFQAQPQAQARPQPAAQPQPQQRAAFEERRAQPRFEHREPRPPVQRQAQPPVQRQAEQPRPQQAQPRHEQRQEQHGERREAREQHGERGRGS